MKAPFSVCALLCRHRSSKNARSQHDLADITAVALSCTGADRRGGYSFSAHREDAAWLLSARCFTPSSDAEVSFERRWLSVDDTTALLELLGQCESISYAESSSRAKKSHFHVADEEIYGFCLTFSDGGRYMTDDRQRKFEKLFYRLAEKYAL